MQLCVCIFLLCYKNQKKPLKKNFQNSLKNTLYTCKQPLMMAYKRPESARDNFGKFIHQFQSETKTSGNSKGLYRQNLSSLFNETCLNERLLPYTHTQTTTLTHTNDYAYTHTNTHTHTHTHIYIYDNFFSIWIPKYLNKMTWTFKHDHK